MCVHVLIHSLTHSISLFIVDHLYNYNVSLLYKYIVHTVHVCVCNVHVFESVNIVSVFVSLCLCVWVRACVCVRSCKPSFIINCFYVF